MTAPTTFDVCLCGRHAIGLAVSPTRPICAECVPILEYVKSVRRPSAYELKARQGGVDAMGPLIEQFGSDLSEYTEEQALMLAGAAWRGVADEIRRLVREGEAPF